jgi:acyl-CoA reductase-like NAD-dependent aldehyde dehydrogenase
MNRVLRYIEKGRGEGGRIILVGNRALKETGGYFVEPTVFDGVANNWSSLKKKSLCQCWLQSL